LSFLLIFVSISLLLSIWFIITLLSDLTETLYGDTTLSCLHLLSRILASFFSFVWALLQFACQLSEALSLKHLEMLLASRVFKDLMHINY
jgi:hypothetical protein